MILERPEQKHKIITDIFLNVLFFSPQFHGNEHEKSAHNLITNGKNSVNGH